jgi:nitrous oxidase accessory protein
MGRSFGRALAVVAAGLALAAAARDQRRPGRAGVAVATPPTADPACPADGRLLRVGVSLQAAVDAAEPGSTLCLSAGRYEGPVEVHAPLTLLGPAAAVVASDGSGTTVRVLADSVVLDGFTVDGSGRRYDKMDAAVYLHGEGVEARDLTLRNALFGIVVEQSTGARVVGNHVLGLAELPVGIRGDGIRLWEVRRSLVAGNRLEDSRDILVWYSPGNRITGNAVVRSRYATHFMYSDDCVVDSATYLQNVVGVFVMYSRGITLRDNLVADNAAADGMGLGVKESGDLVLEGNRFVHDHVCLYLDTSPFREGDSVVVRGNTFAECTAGVTFHSSERRNTFVDNVFRGNETQVAVEGRGTARGVTWSGNYFDDYQGYDLDGDGIGDVSYELRSLSERLVAEHPGLAFFRGTVALEVLDAAARAIPLLQPETLLVDPRPRTSPPGSA